MSLAPQRLNVPGLGYFQGGATFLEKEKVEEGTGGEKMARTLKEAHTYRLETLTDLGP